MSRATPRGALYLHLFDVLDPAGVPGHHNFAHEKTLARIEYYVDAVVAGELRALIAEGDTDAAGLARRAQVLEDLAERRHES